MDRQHYFFKLNPPRTTFAVDMTQEERELMMEHNKYVRQFFNAGKVLAYGPVMDPKCPYGIAVLEMDSEPEVRKFAENDPTVVAGVATYEFYPMRVAGAQKGN